MIRNPIQSQWDRHVEYCIHALGVAYLTSDANDCSHCSHRRLYHKDFRRQEINVFFVSKVASCEGCWSPSKTYRDERGVIVKVRNVS